MEVGEFEAGETENTVFVLRIDMYVEATLDLLELIIMHPFLKPDDQQKEVVNMAQKAIIRYFPVFEKVGGREAYKCRITSSKGAATNIRAGKCKARLLD